MAFGDIEHFGKEKREMLPVRVIPITTDNVAKYWPNTNQGELRRLENGDLYWCIATCPSGEMIGYAAVDCSAGNLFGLMVEEGYRQRGVATQLIEFLKTIFTRLELVNSAGIIGNEFYPKMGFEPSGEFGHMTWRHNV